MGWFRANRRGSGLLALMALAIQFAVAFGHIHIKSGPVPFGPTVAVAAVTLDGDAAGPVGKQHPAADVFCDICATLNLAATGDAVAAPVLALPASFVLAPVQAPDELALLQKRFLLAQSRAPPAV
jgi:hypothetical protein